MKQVHLQALEIYPSCETVSGGKKAAFLLRENAWKIPHLSSQWRFAFTTCKKPYGAFGD